jgi:hypothetical protein
MVLASRAAVKGPGTTGGEANGPPPPRVRAKSASSSAAICASVIRGGRGGCSPPLPPPPLTPAALRSWFWRWGNICKCGRTIVFPHLFKVFFPCLLMLQIVLKTFLSISDFLLFSHFHSFSIFFHHFLGILISHISYFYLIFIIFSFI